MITYKNAIYVGQFKNNLKDGFGICWWPSGELYIGEWSKNLLEGEGVLMIDSQLYQAQFKNNMVHGVCFNLIKNEYFHYYEGHLEGKALRNQEIFDYQYDEVINQSYCEKNYNNFRIGYSSKLTTLEKIIQRHENCGITIINKYIGQAANGIPQGFGILNLDDLSKLKIGIFDGDSLQQIGQVYENKSIYTGGFHKNQKDFMGIEWQDMNQQNIKVQHYQGLLLNQQIESNNSIQFYKLESQMIYSRIMNIQDQSTILLPTFTIPQPISKSEELNNYNANILLKKYKQPLLFRGFSRCLTEKELSDQKILKSIEKTYTNLIRNYFLTQNKPLDQCVVSCDQYTKMLTAKIVCKNNTWRDEVMDFCNKNRYHPCFKHNAVEALKSYKGINIISNDNENDKDKDIREKQNLNLEQIKNYYIEQSQSKDDIFLGDFTEFYFVYEGKNIIDQRTLIVQNVNLNVTIEQINSFMNLFGKVLRINLKKQNKYQANQYIIQYQTLEDSKNALSEIYNKTNPNITQWINIIFVEGVIKLDILLPTEIRSELYDIKLKQEQFLSNLLQLSNDSQNQQQQQPQQQTQIQDQQEQKQQQLQEQQQQQQEEQQHQLNNEDIQDQIQQFQKLPESNQKAILSKLLEYKIKSIGYYQSQQITELLMNEYNYNKIRILRMITNANLLQEEIERELENLYF